MIRTMTFAGVVLMLSACASQVAVDQAVTLRPDQGIAAVVFDAPGHIRQISYAARDPGGKSFEVPDTQGGPALFLTPVKAGRYCLQHFRYERVIYNSTEDLGCFKVIAGHISYGGHIVPIVSPNPGTPGVTDQQYHEAEFVQMLHAQFPTLSAQYPLAAAPPVPAGVEPPSVEYPLDGWVKVNPDRSETVYLQNNTAWSHRLYSFQLYDCDNIKQSCEPQKLDLVFAPFEVKQIEVVEAADASQGFHFRFRYESRTAD